MLLGAHESVRGGLHNAFGFAAADASERVHVCIDTCHAYAAGYDLATPEGFERAWSELDRELVIGRIVAFHLNDSMKPLNCRGDRHATPGKGEMGLYPFFRLVNEPRLARVPGVVELLPTEVPVRKRA